MRLAFSIATRFLKSSMGQTILIVTGITIGVAVQIFIGSLIDGLQVSLVDRTIGSSSQITIVSDTNETYFDMNDELITDIQKDDRLTAVSQSFNAPGFVLEDEDSFSVLMRGFEFETANEIYDFSNKLVDGDIPASEGEVLIGKEFSEKLDLAVGDVLDFVAPSGAAEEVEVVGIFDLGVASLNESWMITELETAQTIFGQEDKISAIEMQAEEVFDADIIAESIEKNTDVSRLDLKVTNWKTENEQLLSGLSGQSISSYMIQVFVLVAVLLGIASVLAVSVVQKSRQLGILKAMGIKDKTASQIFLIQGFLLGTVGGVVGTGLGVGLMYGFTTFVKNPDGTALIPFFLDWQFIGTSVVIAIVASTLAAFIPAKSSSRLNPMEVIKNG
ncbi:ABC transporter permease [Jeotgalibaca porci]|uniref:ABC transporter permease n=1 Tax=Jeotgalibaca porci TaxID=1868793 RepID=UPI0035A106CD